MNATGRPVAADLDFVSLLRKHTNSAIATLQRNLARILTLSALILQKCGARVKSSGDRFVIPQLLIPQSATIRRSPPKRSLCDGVWNSRRSSCRWVPHWKLFVSHKWRTQSHCWLESCERRKCPGNRAHCVPGRSQETLQQAEWRTMTATGANRRKRESRAQLKYEHSSTNWAFDNRSL